MNRSDSRDSSGHYASLSRDNVRQSRQRYSTAELYKPQTTRRRSPSANLLTESYGWSAKHGSHRDDHDRGWHGSQHYVRSPGYSSGRSPDTKLDVMHRESPAASSSSPRSRHVMSPAMTARTRHGTAFRSRSPDDYHKSRDDAVKWTIGSDYDMSQQQISVGAVDESSEASYSSAGPSNAYEHSLSAAATQRRPRNRSSFRVTGRPAYHAYASSYETAYAFYGDWSRPTSSAAELQTAASPVWTTKPTAAESPLPAPPKPRRSRSPGERSTSSSSQSRDFEADVPGSSWEMMGRSNLMDSRDRSPPRHLPASSGYPHVFHPGAGSKGPADFTPKTLPRPLRHTAADDFDNANLRTRASYRRCEEENAPIAKRLRR